MVLHFHFFPTKSKIDTLHKSWHQIQNGYNVARFFRYVIFVKISFVSPMQKILWPQKFRAKVRTFKKTINTRMKKSSILNLKVHLYHYVYSLVTSYTEVSIPSEISARVWRWKVLRITRKWTSKAHALCFEQPSTKNVQNLSKKWFLHRYKILLVWS